ncbi:eukaryotic translation initiation factor 3 subunit [Thraustotheca clavata]|uniref:Eukaryotic translation initiation factor 3 subunit B n=1 Tax=Thraustotheca clavata TaxID=74557 RepID=A0A1W0A063_9STRA|nr:eukaryotic translation initiation factor 3 subunit [Thraustotheca clavata]
MADTLASTLEKLKREASDLSEFLSDDEGDAFDVAALKSEEDAFVNDFSTCVIIDKAPVVTKLKYDKLLAMFNRLIAQIGPLVAIDMPYLPAKAGVEPETAGCLFLEFENDADAKKAVTTLHNFALDKRHTLQVYLYADMLKYANTPDKYTPPAKPEFQPRPNLTNWLADPSGRDMFVLRHGTETELYWSDQGRPTIEYAGEREKSSGKQWCSQYVKWSPSGTYLTTFHPQGIALWGGNSWDKVARFAHKHVNTAVFSPQENYLITANGIEGENSITIWDIRSGKLLRSFAMGGNPNVLDTPFKWSADDRFVARRNKDAITIYELPSMKLLDKKSLKADGVADFFWSPSGSSTLAYWAPEVGNNPARVSLVELPSRREIRQKNLFNVSECQLLWHPSGRYLSVKVIRHSKSKKTTFTNFEIFRTAESLVPVEMLEIKDTIRAFAWEPKGSRFAVIHGESATRSNVSFYDCNGGKKNNEVTLLYTLTEKTCNALFWSPLGNNVVLAGLGEMNGIMEFWDVDEKQSLSIQEHFKFTHLEWDPSGRVVATSVCQPINNFNAKYTMDNGYNLWTFQGKLLEEKRKELFYQFIWRPRPKSLLSDAEYKKVIKNLAKYQKKFNELDKQREKERQEAEAAAKQALIDSFRARLAQRKSAASSRRAAYIALVDGYDSQDDKEFVVQTTTRDEIIEQTEQVVRK